MYTCYEGTESGGVDEMRKIGRRRLREKLRRRKRKMSDAERNSELEQIKTHSMTE